jgi:outer membrane protein OmpA-like peptidoglycan-associated protein
MSRTCPESHRARSLILATALISAAGLIWDAGRSPAAAQAYNGGPNQVIINMDVLNAMPGAYGAPAYGQGYAQGGYGAQPGYSTAPQSQFLPGAPGMAQGMAPGMAPGYAPQYSAPQYAAPLGAPRYLPPYQPYGAAQAGALPLAPGLAGLAVPPSRTPSSVLTTLGPDGRPIQPVVLKKPGSGKKPKKKETYAAPTQQAAAPAPEPVSEPTPEPVAEPAPLPDVPAESEQVAEVTAPTPPAEPTDVPAEVPMPEATPPAPDTGAAIVEAPAPETTAEAPVVEAPAPEDAAAEPAAEQQAAVTPEPPAEEAPADAAVPTSPEATETPAEAQPAEEAAAEEAPAEPDNSAPAAPIAQGGIRIIFPVEENEVPGEANAALDDLAGQMLADESMRIQILCYSSGTVETESKARRKSLARCINIRQYLFKKDVRTTRMDVRALGLKSEGTPADRVDIVPAGS